MSFSLRKLDSLLADYPPETRFAIAYSGGMDSHVLLHAMAALAGTRRWRLRAIHVNHGLQPAAGDWARHCQAVCRDLNVHCEVVGVNARAQPGESPEARARLARYAVLESYARSGWLIVTAHHQEDQAETFLLRLLRGSGVKGLGAMRPVQAYAGSWLLRPLLDCRRDDLQRYARQYRLQWIEDESNADLSLDRNYLRRVVWPHLTARWPAAGRTIARSAAHAADTAALAEDLARQDLAAARQAGETALQLHVLRRLSAVRRRNLLRAFIHEHGLEAPSARVLEQIATGMIDAPADRNPRVCWQGREFRRYRGRLYLLPRLPQVAPGSCLPWDLQSGLELPLGRLQIRPRRGAGLRADAADRGHVQVRFRRGGERIRLPGRRHHHVLKDLLQVAALPPWLRDRLPLLYIDDELALVPGICISAHWNAATGDDALEVHWALPAPYREVMATVRPLTAGA